MAYNIADEGGQSAGGPDVWTFTLTKGEGVTTAGGDFNEAQIFGGPVEIDETLGQNEYEFFAPTGAFSSAVTLNIPGGTGPDGLINSTGQYSFTVDFSQITEDTVVSFVVVGRRLDEDGVVQFEDDDTINIQLLICVASGTEIATPNGPRAVETLSIGDSIRLASGRDETIHWIGSRTLDAADLAANPHLQPIRISKDAFGPDRPNRDLLVSPQHRIDVSGWRAELLFGDTDGLAPAKGLVNGGTIKVADEITEVAYYHVLFSSHEIMLTNNLETESFFPGETSIAGIDDAARRELLELFPQLAQQQGSCFEMAKPAFKAWEARLLAGS